MAESCSLTDGLSLATAVYNRHPGNAQFSPARTDLAVASGDGRGPHHDRRTRTPGVRRRPGGRDDLVHPSCAPVADRRTAACRPPRHPFRRFDMQKHRWGPPKWSPSIKMSGDVLLSHAVTRAVPSAQKGLASGFGMGPGVSPSPWSPKLYGDVVVQDDRTSGTAQWTRSICGQVLGLLVPVSSKRYRSSTSGLSTR